MSNTFEYLNKNGAEALIEELELRYGPAMAQEIADQLDRAADKGQEPQYMLVKAASEMLEVFRDEAQARLADWKAERRSQGRDPKIAHIAERKLELEFKRVFRLYWTSMKLFYPLYAEAMASFKTGPARRFAEPAKATDTSMAA